MRIQQIKAEFERLAALHKAFSIKCKYRCRKKNLEDECHHEDMGYGGMTRNTTCEICNCPRVI